MNYANATKAYTQWLAGQVQPDTALFQTQLREKDRKMADGVFPFLRGTFYRWVEWWPEKCPNLASRDQDTVMAVGDLHLENFGTWRDAEHRLVWGINDFDEAHQMAFTSDLVRLATSALAAAEDFSIAMEAREAATSLLKGYRSGCAGGGSPFILDSAHRTLRDLIDEALADGDVPKFWKKLRKPDDYPLSSPELTVPADVQELLQASLPAGTQDAEYRVVVKAKGLGSLGRPRYLAIGAWNGGRVAREIKRLAPSAVEWLADPQSARTASHKLARLGPPFRSPDPTYLAHGQWVMRALSPDSVKVELKALPPGRETREVILYLLEHMGAETANIHLATSASAGLLASLNELDELNPQWLAEATTKMWKATCKDWKSFT